ncbi:MAG: hypothetical protein AAF483_05195 [Planctomycetota bacterium]
MDARQVNWQVVLGPLFQQLDSIELEAVNEALFKHSARAVRKHSLVAAALPFATREVPWFENGFWLEEDVRPGAFLQHAAGDYYVQDAGSMLALALCDVQPGHCVIDTCASPGGKASAILESLRGQGWLLANEVIGSRLSQLQLTLERTGLANFMVCNQDLDRLAAIVASSNSLADCVLLDAPCTGQSMLAKGKQSLSAFSDKQIEHNAARQRKLIRHAAEMVRPGGKLVYSTCAFSFAENEAIIEDFCNEHSGWQTIRDPALQAWEVEGWPGCYRVWPHRDSCAGAFAAALRRSDDDQDLEFNSGLEKSKAMKRRRASHRKWQQLEAVNDASFLPTIDPSFQYFAKNIDLAAHSKRKGKSKELQELHAFPVLASEDLFQACVSGSRWAERSESDHASKVQAVAGWEPRYASGVLRLKDSESTSCPVLELSDDQAIKYVAGESVRVSSSARGWVRLVWQGRLLGWGKLTPPILKNHFPKNLRQPSYISDPQFPT